MIFAGGFIAGAIVATLLGLYASIKMGRREVQRQQRLEAARVAEALRHPRGRTGS